MFDNKPNLAVLILAVLAASCDSPGARHELEKEDSAGSGQVELRLQTPEPSHLEKSNGAPFNEGEFLEIAKRHAASELHLGEGSYSCKVVSVDDSEVRVSVRTRPFDGKPGGGGELVLYINRVTKKVEEVLHSQ